MKNFLLFVTSLFLSTLSFAQLEVTIAVNDEVVLDWLGGADVNVTNLSVECFPEAYGTFFNPSLENGLDIVDGLILTTGYAELASGPNTQSGASGTDPLSPSGDPDLEQSLPGYEMNDVCRVEFDIVPTFENLVFNFVFGSEEYLEWVDSGFNDIFGFYVSGPGIEGPFTNGAINASVVPGTDLPIAIDNVNNIVNQEYYVDNGDGSTEPFNSDNMYVQYDGMTTNITGIVSVQETETYHVKIVIADAGDTAYDSGVFLQKDCFKSVSGIVGVEELEDLQISLFPNPADDYLLLTGSDVKDFSNYQLMNSEGKVIEAGLIGNQNPQIAISHLNAGQYFVQLISKEGMTGTFAWFKK